MSEDKERWELPVFETSDDGKHVTMERSFWQSIEKGMAEMRRQNIQLHDELARVSGETAYAQTMADEIRSLRQESAEYGKSLRETASALAEIARSQSALIAERDAARKERDYWVERARHALDEIHAARITVHDATARSLAFDTFNEALGRIARTLGVEDELAYSDLPALIEHYWAAATPDQRQAVRNAALARLDDMGRVNSSQI